MENPEQVPYSPELKDIIEMVKRYSISNPDACFIFGFLGFEEDKNHICEEYGEHGCSKISESKTSLGAYGDLETLRHMLNDLRNGIEDFQEEGFVSF